MNTLTFRAHANQQIQDQGARLGRMATNIAFAEADCPWLDDLGLSQHFSVYFDAWRGGITVYASHREGHSAEAQGHFRAFLAATMDAAGVTAVEKRRKGNNRLASITIHSKDDARSHAFHFTWYGTCEAPAKYRVTKTEIIEVCGEIDHSRYDSVEEITDED